MFTIWGAHGLSVCCSFQTDYTHRGTLSTSIWQMTGVNKLIKRKWLGAVLLDFSPAFGVIDHKVLLEKLKCYGFALPARAWFKSCISYRIQRFCWMVAYLMWNIYSRCVYMDIIFLLLFWLKSPQKIIWLKMYCVNTSSNQIVLNLITFWIWLKQVVYTVL